MALKLKKKKTFSPDLNLNPLNLIDVPHKSIPNIHTQKLNFQEISLLGLDSLKNVIKMLYQSFYFKYEVLLLFLHNSHGTPEFTDCGILARED